MASTKKTTAPKSEKIKPAVKKTARLVKQDEVIETPVVVKKKRVVEANEAAQSVEAAPQAERDVEAPKPKVSAVKVRADGRTYATGRRKTSVARVWIKQGGGSFTVNDQHHGQYFKRPAHLSVVTKPFIVTDTQGLYTVVCTVAGGGSSGQAGAVAHGISRAIAKIDEALRPLLSKAGLLTRDKRKVERKNPARKKRAVASNFPNVKDLFSLDLKLDERIYRLHL